MKTKAKVPAVLAALLGGLLGSAYLSAQPVGYATQNGGTTGGAGGQVVHATTGTQIHAALCNRASSSTPIIIHVEGTINHGNTSKVSGPSCNTADDKIEIKEVSNVSLIGVGNGALFDQLGIHLRDASNIILQNLHVRNVKKSGSPISNGGDAIGMERNVYNVWVDHVTLEASGGESEGYDALIDMKDTTKYVTISYSILRNSGRGGLVGSSDSDSNNGPVTYHHNLFQNLDSRVPLLRHATAHAFNNYYRQINASGMNPRIGGRIRADNNYFENSKDVLGTFYTNDMGYWHVNGNIFSNVTWSNEGNNNHPAGPNPVSTTTINIPYSYNMDTASCVPQVVLATAGANTGLQRSNFSCSGGGSSSGGSSGGGSSGGSSSGGLGSNLAITGPGAGADGSSKASGTSYGDVRDGDLSSYWQPTSSSGQRVSVKWSSAQSFNTVILRENGSAAQSWRLVNNDNGQQLASGTGIGSSRQVNLGNVSMSKINLMIDSASSAPRITEFEVYNSGGSSGGGSSSGGSSSGGGTPTTITLQENASGFCSVQGPVENEHSGYTGFGYANTDNAWGNGINWAVWVPSSGLYTLQWRYANAGGARSSAVLVGGNQVASISMGPTGAWSSWADSGTVQVGLSAGHNQLRLEATNAEGLANIDWMRVTGNGPQAGNCN